MISSQNNPSTKQTPHHNVLKRVQHLSVVINVLFSQFVYKVEGGQGILGHLGSDGRFLQTFLFHPHWGVLFVFDHRFFSGMGTSDAKKAEGAIRERIPGAFEVHKGPPSESDVYKNASVVADMGQDMYGRNLEG